MISSPATQRISLGELSQRLTLESRAAGSDALGQESGPWVAVATVWARARPLRSRELFAAGQTGSVAEVEFTIRYRSDVLSTWRATWKGVPYEIVGEPIDVDAAGQWLQILAAKGVRNAL